MSIIDLLLSVLAPYECFVCGAESGLLCVPCSSSLIDAPERCYRCLSDSPGMLTCAVCAQASHLHHVRAGAVYSGLAKELVSRFKFSGARAAAKIMAERMSPLAASLGTDLAIVPVPTAASRVRGRGFDQSKLLARELSRRTRLAYLDCLSRSGHTRQVGMSRRRRLSQLEGAFRVTGPGRIPGRSIILVDDVLTTGATLEAAAKVLDGHGAAQISAVVFAQA